MSRSVDLLILGGGIYGATAACEAVRRGLSVLLVERGDLGGGASSNSLRIAHGGLRYLQSLDLARSFESIRERRRLLRLAPRFVRPLVCRLDETGRSSSYRLALRAGLALNDALSAHRNRGVAPPSRLSRSRYPVWHDALIEDTERVLFSFLHAARAWGSFELVSHARATPPLRDAAGLCCAVEGLGEVRPRALLRCVGATRPGQRVMLAMNLVLDAQPLCASGEALAVAHPDERRNVFVVPWRGRTVVGTYNREYPYSPDAPLRIEPGWIDELIEWVRPVHRDFAALRREHVRLVSAGLLPRGSGRRPDPAEKPRIRRDSDGVIDVQGVKWTTAYGVAERALDTVESTLGRAHTRPPEKPLLDPSALLEEFLKSRPELEAPLLPGNPLRAGEVLFALEREWARDLADVLLRRTASAATGHPGRALVARVAELLQRELGWSECEKHDQIGAFDSDFHFAGNVPA